MSIADTGKRFENLPELRERLLCDYQKDGRELLCLFFNVGDEIKMKQLYGKNSNNHTDFAILYLDTTNGTVKCNIGEYFHLYNTCDGYESDLDYEWRFLDKITCRDIGEGFEMFSEETLTFIHELGIVTYTDEGEVFLDENGDLVFDDEPFTRHFYCSNVELRKMLRSHLIKKYHHDCG